MASLPSSGSEPDDKAEPVQSPPQSAQRSGRRWGRTLVSTILLTYVGLLGALIALEPQLVFPGAYKSFPDPKPNMASRPWQYTAADGKPIEGRLLQRPGAKRTVLFLHGNGIKAVMLDDWIAQLGRNLDANVMAAEYRGFEDPDLTPTESNVTADAIAAFDALRDHYSLAPGELIVYGRSLGGGCAAAVAAERRVDTLILDRTFDSVADVGATRYPVFPVRWLVRNRFDSVSWLQDFRGDLIQIHGTPDRIVPMKHGKVLYDSIDGASKVFIEVPDLRHTGRMPDAVLQQVRQRLDELGV